MLTKTLALALLITFPVAARAQTAAAPAATNSDDDLGSLPPAADATVAKPLQSDSTLDEPITTIAGTADGCAVLDRDFPGLRAHPMYQFFKTMTLNQIAALSHGQITQEMLRQAQADLDAQNKKAVTAAATSVAPVAAPIPVATAAPATLLH
jgi:hypothetical protein